MSRETALWSIQKQHWIPGPKLPDFFSEKFRSQKICFVAINRHEIFAFNMYTGGEIYNYNFKSKSEKLLDGKTPIFLDGYLTSCMMYHTKTYQK